MNSKRVVLAYSGGVDTTACIPYLKHEISCERVVAMTADAGQGENLELIRLKALQAGADDAMVIDAQDDFISRFGLPGRGLFVGLRFAQPSRAEDFRRAVLGRGVLTETCGPSDEVVKFMPAINIPEEVLLEGLYEIDGCAEEMAL